jgi:hypothetical protein
MRYCSRCLYPENHPLNIVFNEDGLCSGCVVHEEKDVLDWSERLTKLKRILNTYKNTSKNNYDCLPLPYEIKASTTRGIECHEQGYTHGKTWYSIC